MPIDRPAFSARAGNGGESGQGLVYVLIVGAVLLVLLTTFVDILVREMRWIVGTGKRNIMVHAGDGAIDRAMHSLQVGGNWDAMGKRLIEGYRRDVTFTDVPEIAYTIDVQEGNWTPYPGPAVLAETAFTPAGDKRLDRTITVYLSNTKTGEKKKIQTVVMQTTLDSALFSGGTITIGGNAKVHWGPVVSYSTESNSIDLGKTVPDFPIFMSCGGLIINGKTAGNNSPSLDCDDPIAHECVDEYAADKLGTIPEMPIDYWRATAKSQFTGGTHYFGSGNKCMSISGPTMPIMDDNSVVFFDTADGKNFEWPRDSICDKTYSGGDDRGCNVTFPAKSCGAGVMVVMGDLTSVGTGSCTNPLQLTAPSNCVGRLEYDPLGCNPVDTKNAGLFWNGFIYVANKLHSNGDKMIYGSIYVRDSTDISGNFSVYFKSNSAGMGTLGKTIVRKIWMERGPKPGEKYP